jgi:hypothetical protein
MSAAWADAIADQIEILRAKNALRMTRLEEYADDNAFLVLMPLADSSPAR